MNIKQNVSLRDYSTMRLGGTARFSTILENEDDIETALMFAENNKCSFKVIGSGSNLIWGDGGYDGLLMINKIDFIDISTETGLVTIGAGKDWDEAVKETVKAGLSGIEFLSLIPGTSGATPVQNVGAYGTEIKDVLVSLRAFDTQERKFVQINNEQCDFSYRKSRFNSKDAGRFVISSITLQLTKKAPKPPFYQSLQQYLDSNNITSYSPEIIRESVIKVRTAKLPDPDVVANNGSFFKNPIITKNEFLLLKEKYPDIVSWEIDGKIKLSAAWMIEKAGFANYHDVETGMATWDKQSLVLINESAKSSKDLYKFVAKITDSVYELFNIKLDREPEIIN